MNDELCDAIRNKNLVEFLYDGNLRIVEPYCYGITYKGRQCLNAYQIGGDSPSGKYGWKMFDLAKAGKMTVLEKTYRQPRKDYVKGGSGMKTVFCEL